MSALNRLWPKTGAAIIKVVNFIVMVLLFFFVVTPMAIAMRLVRRRPLRLAHDRSASSYWIERRPQESGLSNMRRQF